jgi:DNA sulfur modification protein DndB
LDEDDIVAIVTRAIVEGDGLMTAEHVSLKKTKAIPPTDTTSITSIVSLYKAHEAYLAKEVAPQEWKRYIRRRPSDSDVDKYCAEAQAFWTTMGRYIAPFRQLLSSKKEWSTSKYRNSDGGHFLFRPVGLEAAVTAIVTAMQRDQLSLDEAVRRLAKVPMALDDVPWNGLLWDEVGKKMLTREGRLPLAVRMLLYMMNCKFDGKRGRKEAITALTKSYAASLNRPISETELPPVVVEGSTTTEDK